LEKEDNPAFAEIIFLPPPLSSPPSGNSLKPAHRHPSNGQGFLRRSNVNKTGFF
jgi:hypothetical protein